MDVNSWPPLLPWGKWNSEFVTFHLSRHISLGLVHTDTEKLFCFCISVSSGLSMDIFVKFAVVSNIHLFFHLFLHCLCLLARGVFLKTIVTRLNERLCRLQRNCQSPVNFGLRKCTPGRGDSEICTKCVTEQMSEVCSNSWLFSSSELNILSLINPSGVPANTLNKCTLFSRACTDTVCCMHVPGEGVH